MPYTTLSDLPDTIKNVLPHHAQEIYRAAFNQAWANYKNPEKRNAQETHEEVAHKVAWTAVKQKYVKKGETWVERS